MNPEFIVLDEPISALDVSIQAQVVNLLIELQKYGDVLVAHATVDEHFHRIAVLYLGNLVELATSEQLFANPQHPYTQALLSAIPIPDPDVEQERDAKKIRLEGEIIQARSIRLRDVNSKLTCKYRTAACDRNFRRCGILATVILLPNRCFEAE